MRWRRGTLAYRPVWALRWTQAGIPRQLAQVGTVVAVGGVRGKRCRRYCCVSDPFPKGRPRRRWLVPGASRKSERGGEPGTRCIAATRSREASRRVCSGLARAIGDCTCIVLLGLRPVHSGAQAANVRSGLDLSGRRWPRRVCRPSEGLKEGSASGGSSLVLGDLAKPRLPAAGRLRRSSLVLEPSERPSCLPAASERRE